MMTITCVAYNLIRLNPAVSKSDGYSGLHWIKRASQWETFIYASDKMYQLFNM